MVRRLAAALVAGAVALSLGPLAAGAQELPPVPAVPDTDSDTGGHDTQDPAGADHASASAWEMTSTNDAGGQDEFLTVGRTHAEMDEDGANRSKATALSVGGNELVGTQSEARNDTDEDESIGAPICDPSLTLCAGVAYARTEGRDNAQSSFSRSEAAVAYGCFGVGILDDCLIALYALYSESEVSQDKGSGRTTSSARSRPLLACILGALCFGGTSDSSSETNGAGDGTTSRDSRFYVLTPEGEQIYDDSETFWGDLTAGDAGDGECPEDIGFGYCAHFNQGESFMFPGGAGSRQEAMHAVGFSEGEVFGNFHLGTAETLARVALDDVLPDVIRRHTVATLALTGGSVQALAAIALALMLVGTMVVAGSRRETA